MSQSDLNIPGLVVSRETLDRLNAFVALTAKWTAKINLISAASVPHLWERHIRDSAQLVPLIKTAPKSWIDLGSGGGFPGIVVAAIAAELWPDMAMTLVESDQRKATFLRTASRELGLKVRVLDARINEVPPAQAEVMSARALAPLTDLLGFAHLHLAPGGIALFPKGRTTQQEIDEARGKWRFDLAKHPSLTDHEASILQIEGVEHG